MARKVRPIKVKKMRVNRITPGEFFTLNGTQYIMINPHNSYNEFAADVLVIINGECQNTMVLGDAIAHVRAVVNPMR